MEKDRKIAKVARVVTHEQSEEDDLLYWAGKSWQERLTEVQMLRERIWSWKRGSYPSKIEITGGKFLKRDTDEDDF